MFVTDLSPDCFSELFFAKHKKTNLRLCCLLILIIAGLYSEPSKNNSTGTDDDIDS